MYTELLNIIYKMNVQPFQDENGDSILQDLVDTILYNYALGWKPEHSKSLTTSEKDVCNVLQAIRDNA